MTENGHEKSSRITRSWTDAQRSFIESLARRVHGETADEFLQQLTTAGACPTRTEASALIETLKRQATTATPGAVATAARQQPSTTDIPAGRYALEGTTGNIIFYQIDRPQVGRWTGYTFVSAVAGDTQHAVRGQERKAILELIDADPLAASVRYGRAIGQCGMCGRTLTDEESRQRGIGPICANKL